MPEDNSLRQASGAASSDGPTSSHEAAAPHPAPVTYSSLLRNANFRMLWLGEAFSTFGSLFTRLAIPIYVFTLTSSYAQLGLAFFFSLAASLLFGLFAGALVDRWDRRRTMIVASILNGLVLLALIVLISQPLVLSLKLAGVYALIFVSAILRDFFAAARVAIFPEILEERELLTANALDQATTQFAELLSYPLAIAVLYVGPRLAFGIDAVTFLVAALFLVAVRTAPKAVLATDESNVLHEIATGLRTAWRLQMIRKILLLSLIVPLIFSLIFTLQLPYAQDVAHSTQEVGLPLLEGSMALGFLIGALIIGHRAKHMARGAMLAYGITGMGGALMLQGLLPYVLPLITLPALLYQLGPLTPPLLFALPALLLLGMTNSLVNTSTRTVVQEQTPGAVLGRVFSVIQVAASVGFAAGALLTGLAQGRVPQILTGMGITLVVIGLVARWWLKPDESLIPSSDTEGSIALKRIPPDADFG